MKMNKTLMAAGFFCWLLAFALLSCSEDEEMESAEVMTSCTDGIMNGNETAVDCGGDCEPCDSSTPMGRRAELYVTNNTDGNITKYDLTTGAKITFETNSIAAEGIYYDANGDILVQASRSSLQLDAYSGTSMLTDNTALTADFSGSPDLESPRELAVSGSTYVVSDNGTNQLFVYESGSSGFSLTATIDIPFPLWGIAFKGDDLYAVVDTTGDLAVFYNFLAKAVTGTLAPSKRVTIEGIVRTHGLTYDGTDDVMIMTDIGDAANTSDDGGFHVISDFSQKFDLLSDGDLLPLSMQVRVAGASTLMGNPIDVAYDSDTDAVYISEVGNGKVLGFSAIGNGGNLSPTFREDLATASSLYFSSDETDNNTGEATAGQQSLLYATTTSCGDISVYDAMGNLLKVVTSASTSTEGIFYSAMQDAVIQASRSNLQLEYYGNFSGAMDDETISADFSGPAELTSPREIAVFGNKIVVSDNGANIFYVYTFNGSSFELLNMFTAGFNLWGITFKGNDLLAVVDTSGDLAVFNDFLYTNTTDGAIFPDKRITIDGIVRTHGIDYSEADDVLVMTDIGDAANTLDDGGFHVIQGFGSKLDAIEDGGSLALADQVRIAGAATLMGNPIDIAYDSKTKTVFIAEIGNSKILGFTDVLNSSGEIAPVINNNLDAASSLYLYSN